MTKKLLIVIFSFIIIPYCYSSGKWEKDKEINGIVYDKVKMSSSGTIICKIKSSVSVNGIEYKDWIHFTSSYQIKAGDIANKVTYNGLNIMENTWIEFKVNSFSCCYPKNVDVDTLTLLGCMFGSEGIKQEFYTNGQIKKAYIKNHSIIQGIPVKGGIFNPVVFDQDGVLISCTILKDIDMNGKILKKNTKYNRE